MAGPAFVEFMQVANEGRPASEFPRPDGISTLLVDPATGLLPWPGQTNAVAEDFLEGTEPKRAADEPAFRGAPAGLVAPTGLQLPVR